MTDGKTQHAYHLLPYHCLDVAAAGQQILLQDPILLRKIIPKGFVVDEPGRERWFIGIITFLLALHDIGKFSDRFQKRRPDILEELKGYSYGLPSVHHTDMGRLLFDNVIWQMIWKERWFCLNPQDDSSDWSDVWNPLFLAVTGHHGTPPKKPDLPISSLFEDENQQSAIQFAEGCKTLFLKSNLRNYLAFSEQYLLDFTQSSWLLAGLAVLSDWIGSNNEYFSYSSTPMSLETYWNDYALPKAQKAIHSFGILPCKISPESGMHALFPEHASPTPLQSFADTCEISSTPQLFILEEATGSGKTEAALVLAHRMMARGLGGGIYFGLPTMATANAMYDRMGKAYDQFYSSDSHPSLVLAHGARHLSEKFQQSIGYSKSKMAEQEFSDEMSASAQCTTWLSDNRKKALLAQIGVGTIDQALMAVLTSRHQSLRLIGLSRNVLIVDEIHAYDAYVEWILENLLRFHAAMGGSTILLSATLPRTQRQALISAYSSGLGLSCDEVQQSHYPMVTQVTSQAKKPAEFSIEKCEKSHRTIEVECTDDHALVMSYLSKVILEGRCACWVKNTVDDAIEAYRNLSQKIGNEHVLLFHARFTMGDRINIENEVLRTFGKESDLAIRSGKILIATQVVEQSLDLDFDFMVTDLAPMDLIIQRAGRLHRHQDPDKRGDRGTPRLVVIMPRFLENPPYEWYTAVFRRGAYVYKNHGQLWLTARLLTSRKKITMPDDARLLIEGTFGEVAQREIPESINDHEIKSEGKKMADQATAQYNILKLNEGYKITPHQWLEDKGSPTRLGEVRVTLLLLKWEDSNLHFFSSDEKFAKDLSQVGIPDRKISGEYPYTGDLGDTLKRFKANLPDKGKWIILVPLTLVNHEWRGKALAKDKSEVGIIYDEKLGLRLTKA